jgi:hypothetical protein
MSERQVNRYGTNGQIRIRHAGRRHKTYIGKERPAE